MIPGNLIDPWPKGVRNMRRRENLEPNILQGVLGLFHAPQVPPTEPGESTAVEFVEEPCRIGVTAAEPTHKGKRGVTISAWCPFGSGIHLLIPPCPGVRTTVATAQTSPGQPLGAAPGASDLLALTPFTRPTQGGDSGLNFHKILRRIPIIRSIHLAQGVGRLVHAAASILIPRRVAPYQGAPAVALPSLTRGLATLGCDFMSRTGAIWVSMVACGLTAGNVAAAPKVGVATTSWELDFKFFDPQRITLQLPGDAEFTTFWYVLYEVTNNTGREVEFYPSFRLVTDTLKVVEAGEEISPSVYDAIAARHRNEWPFFAPPWKVTGPVLQGTQNARASAAVFRDFDKHASKFTVFVGGLSGELARVANPTVSLGPEALGTGKPYYVLRRTLAIRYDLPGDPNTRAGAVPIRRGREWVMR